MLQVKQYEFIRTGYRLYGLSISEISQRTGHSRNTIRKILQNEHMGYSKRSYQPYPVLEGYAQDIDNWLLEDKEHPRKQRHTARRIYNRLVKEYGFTGSESTVRRYVREAKARLGLRVQKVFIPGDPDIGLEAEVDWGDFTAEIANESMRCKLFCLRPKYSGKCFARAYFVERQQCLFDGHMRAFSFFNGVFKRLIYDNMTTAVLKVLKGKKRIEQDKFSTFRAYYTFESIFCTPGEGHEKGGVEGLVGFVRRNFLVPIPKVKTLDELNEYLLQECLTYGSHIISGREKSVEELFEHEKEHLLSLPKVAYSNDLPASGKVDHYSTVIIDKNRYSVPTQHAGFKVDILLSIERVCIFHDGKQIASHKRVYGNNKWILDPEHYLDLLYKRPGAFDTARPIKQWRAQWPENHEKLLNRLQTAQGINKGTKDFIEVLKLYKDHDYETMEAAIDLALASGVSSGEAVKHVLEAPAEQAKPGRLQSWTVFPQPDTSIYNRLGGVS